MAIFILLVNEHTGTGSLALVVALLAGRQLGSFIGFFVARIGIPSFVVTLGLFLAFQGLMLVLLGDAGSYRIETPAVVAIMNKTMPLWAGWVMLAVIVAVSLATAFYDRRRRQARRRADAADRACCGSASRPGSWAAASSCSC